MRNSDTRDDDAPLVSRLIGHASELIRLAGPVVVGRSGIMIMAMVDTVMVGRFSTQELAFQGIGQAPVIPLLLAMMGLMMGTLVSSASAYGAGRTEECGAAWRRSLPLALGAGFAAALLCAPGEPLLRALGQTPELSSGGGEVVQILGLGLPAALVFLTTNFFLEGIKRPVPGMVMVIVANIVNVLLNWVLIYGHLGFPAMGAAGSAWATTGVRVFLAVGLVAYVWAMPDHARFAVRARPAGGWGVWRSQRRIGYAAGASIGVEAMAFSAVSVFAGWLGPVPLAGYSIALNLISMVFMVAIGVGSATAVRVGIERGNRRASGMALAGWTGLAVNTVAMSGFGILFAAVPDGLVSLYTADPELRALTVPLVAFCAWVLVADGGQGVMANALRGRGETWVPTSLHVFSYFGVMVPVCWFLSSFLGHGVMGLFEGILIASIVSVGLLCGRFFLLCRRDARLRRLHPDAHLR
jgi:MATE family multidrug resistance protein